MVGLTIVQLIPFILFFLMWIIFFTVCFVTLRIEIRDADDDYKNVFSFFRYFLMTYRNSVGDITTPIYDNWLTSMND